MADEKLLLRKKIRSQRALLTAEYRDAVDCAIAHRMMDWEGYRQAETIFLYVGVKNEISTWKLIETAFRQGKIIALPKSFENGVMHFYRYHGEVAEGKYGIPEPQSEELLVPDGNSLMIVPGLAFDSFGYRLGQGGGYYDRYLTMHDAVKTVGLCRGEFFFESLPRAWNDLPVDYVITEDDLFFCKEKRSF